MLHNICSEAISSLFLGFIFTGEAIFRGLIFMIRDYWLFTFRFEGLCQYSPVCFFAMNPYFWIIFMIFLCILWVAIFLRLIIRFDSRIVLPFSLVRLFHDFSGWDVRSRRWISYYCSNWLLISLLILLLILHLSVLFGYS